MIEYVFGYIKNITYRKIYQTLNGLLFDVKIILKSDKIKNALKNLYVL